MIAREAYAGRDLMEASMFLDHKAIGVEKDISYLSDRRRYSAKTA